MQHLHSHSNSTNFRSWNSHSTNANFEQLRHITSLKSRPNFAFFSRVKIRGGIGEISESRSSVAYETRSYILLWATVWPNEEQKKEEKEKEAQWQNMRPHTSLGGIVVCMYVYCGCCQALCKSVQQENILQTVQLVLSGADVCYAISLCLTLSELFCAVLCTEVVHSHKHT